MVRGAHGSLEQADWSAEKVDLMRGPFLNTQFVSRVTLVLLKRDILTDNLEFRFKFTLLDIYYLHKSYIFIFDLKQT